MLISVVLPAAGAADDRGDLAGLGQEVDVAEHGLLRAGIPELHVRATPAARWAATLCGESGGSTAGSVSSTSTIRSAQTSARGIIMNMNVAIITDIRICSR